MKEFQIIATSDSAAKLGKILKNEELEQYGTSFTPEFIYQAIEPDKRFENMRVRFFFRSTHFFHSQVECPLANQLAARSSARCRGILRPPSTVAR